MSSTLTAIGDVLAPAVGIALSPLPVSAAILLLLGPKPVSRNLALVVGWVVGVVAVASVVTFVLGGAATDDAGAPSSGIGWGKVVLGALLIALAARTWRGRPAPGEEPEQPRWMARLDTLGVGGSFVGGVALSAVNPKNLLLGVAAGTSIAASDLEVGSEVAVVAVYSVLASVTIVLPVLVYAAARDSAAARLTSARVWLVEHNAVVVGVVLLLLGVKVLGDGLGFLS